MPIPNGEEVLIGESYTVRGRRGYWCNATVLDKRHGENGNVELYVHFDGDDRRLDHWLDCSRLKFRHKPGKRRTSTHEMREKRLRKSKECSPSNNNLDYTDFLEEQHKEVTKVKYIEVVRYGEYEMDTWYVSPYPDEYGKERYLYICDHCFLYMRQERAYKMHLSSCIATHPPGKEIYVDRVENIAVYEVDGDQEKLFCQCLCLFAKLFMDHKTIYFDVTGFLFYVVCQLKSSGGTRPVGYFSKERTSLDDHNLSCLLVFPAFQRQGFGSFLIQLSYELSRREGLQGSPEKPLSDLGLASFRHYWAYIIVEYLSAFMDTSSIKASDLARTLGMQVADVVDTLQWLKICDPAVMAEEMGDAEVWVHVYIKHLDSLRKFAAKPPRLMLNSRLLHWRPNRVLDKH